MGVKCPSLARSSADERVCVADSHFRQSDFGWRQLFQGAVLLVAMTVVGVGVLVQLTWALKWIFGDVVAGAIVAGSAPLIASMGVGIWSSRVERQRALELDRLQQKAEAFRDLLDHLYWAIQETERGANVELDMEREDYRALLEGVLAWSSDDLIELWNEFRSLDFSSLSQEERLEWYGRLLEQVRHELREDSDLTAEALYELYLLQSENGEAPADSVDD